MLMANEFRIRFTLKTVKGFEPLCDFYIGNNRDIALSIFTQLEGNDEVGEADILRLDFVEIRNGLPFNMKIKHCTLFQLTSNCRLITREVFKYRNLMENF
jgi:hypothetical protein